MSKDRSSTEDRDSDTELLRTYGMHNWQAMLVILQIEAALAVPLQAHMDEYDEEFDYEMEEEPMSA